MENTVLCNGTVSVRRELTTEKITRRVVCGSNSSNLYSEDLASNVDKHRLFVGLSCSSSV